MNDDDQLPYSDLLGQLRFSLEVPVDFTRTDPETTPTKVRLLTAAATYFNFLTVSEFGGRQGPARAAGLVEQVVAAAFQTFDGTEIHPDPFDKAAMLLRGITQGHPFADGNKRSGFLLATYFLARVGYSLDPEVDEAEIIGFCLRVSAGEVRDVAEIARALATWSIPRTEPTR
jgi:death-on-curing protein